MAISIPAPTVTALPDVDVDPAADVACQMTRACANPATWAGLGDVCRHFSTFCDAHHDEVDRLMELADGSSTTLTLTHLTCGTANTALTWRRL